MNSTGKIFFAAVSIVLEIVITFLALILLVLMVITLPIWWQFIRVLRWYGTAGARCRNGILEAPIATYKHPQTGRLVTFLGVAHVAKKSFYHLLQPELDAAEKRGDIILYELITSELDLFGDAWMDDELLQQMMVPEEQEIGTRLLSIMPQSIGLKFSKHWINADISTEQLEALEKRHEAKRGVFSHICSDVRQTALALLNLALSNLVPENIMTPYLHRWILQEEFLAVPAFLILERLSGKIFGSFSEEVIMNLRNNVLICFADNALELGNITIIYGGEHLSGIDPLLRERGFELTKKTWLPVYQRQPFNMFGE